MADRFGYDEIQRPDYCTCETPWQAPTGPLKDGSHYSDCVAAEVAEDMDGLKAEVRALTARLDAAHTVIRHAVDHWLTFGDCEFPREWTDDDWSDSGWSPAEAAEIRAATADPTPQTETEQ